MDLVVMTSIVVTFAAFCTVHVAIAASLALRGPWWRGVVALLVVPLAFYWALREKLKVRAFTWAGSLVAYVASRVVAASLGA